MKRKLGAILERTHDALRPCDGLRWTHYYDVCSRCTEHRLLDRLGMLGGENVGNVGDATHWRHERLLSVPCC